MLIPLYIGLALATGMFFVEYYARAKELDFFASKIANLQRQLESVRVEVTILRNERGAPSFESIPALSLQSIGTGGADDNQQESRVIAAKAVGSRPTAHGSAAEMRLYSTPSVWRRRPAQMSPDDSVSQYDSDEDVHHKKK